LVSSAVLIEEFEELVSLMIVIGISGVEYCACIFGIMGTVKSLEDVKSADI
jgi:hypothetical protein